MRQQAHSLAGLLLLALAACSGDDGAAGAPDSDVGDIRPADADADTGAADDTRPADTGTDTADADAAIDVPDADVDEGPTGPCGPIGTPRVYAIYALSFAREEAPSTARGFDIDGETSAPGDPLGCGKPDFSHPDGTPGIDNQFARLIPTLENLLGEDPDDSLVRAIEEAELILLFEIESLDDPLDDECVSVNVFRGTSDVVFGADGFLLAGQSYDINLERPWARVERAEVIDGELFASRFRLELPLTFFSTDVELVLAETFVRLPLNAEDVEGEFGGGITVADFITTVVSIDLGFADVASGLLESNADLWPGDNGVCDAVSIAWSFRARAGHLYPDTHRPID